MSEDPRRAVDGLDWATQKREPPLEQPLAAPAVTVRARRWVVPVTTAGAALAGGLLSGVFVAVMAGRDDKAPTAATEPGAVTQVIIQHSSAVTDAATRGRANVVKIESERKAANGAIERDVGSGVILDAAGHIATNAHVVLGTDALKVILADGSERPALLLGHDFPFTDVAVLQVGPGGLSPIERGDSERLLVGESVIAIGSPLVEFQGTVTLGVVSGLRRSRVFDAIRYDDLIQTDAAINSGNSGGGLFDLSGRFVGMPTAILRQARGTTAAPVEGIGFALPSNRVLDIAGRIIAAGGAIARPSMGLEHTDLGPENNARPPRGGPAQGALIVAVAASGPAAEAGLQPGDVITQLGGEVIDAQRLLLNVLIRYEPGQVVKVVLSRAGRIIETEVKLTRRS